MKRLLIFSILFFIAHVLDVGFGFADGRVHAIIPALIAAGATIAGGLINSFSGASANRTNQSIAASNNQANQQLQNTQNSWNLAQWNRENVYNSASSQRQRLEDAGLNPYMMLDGGSAGTASSLQSAPYTPAQPVTVNPVNYGSALSDAVNTYFNVKLNSANVQKAQADADLATTNATVAKEMLPVNKRLTQEDIGNRSMDTELKSSQVTSQDLHNEVFRAFGKSMSQVELAKMSKEIEDLSSQIALRASNSRLNDSEISLNVKRGIAEIAKSHNLDASTSNINSLTPVTVANVRAQSHMYNSDSRYQDILNQYSPQSLTKQIRQQGADYWNPFRYVGTLLGGTGAAAVTRLAK